MDKTMVSVPVEPTEAMLKAAHAAMLSDIPPDGESTYGPTISTHAIYRAYWAAMLSAAPAPQPVQGEAVAFWWERDLIGGQRATGCEMGLVVFAEDAPKNADRIKPLFTQPPAPAVGDEAAKRMGYASVMDALDDLADYRKETPAVQIAAPGDVEQHIAALRAMLADEYSFDEGSSAIFTQERAALGAAIAALAQQANKDAPKASD